MSNVEHVGVSTQLSRDEQVGEQLFEEERKHGLWRSVVTHKRIILHSIAAFGAGKSSTKPQDTILTSK